MGVFSGSRKKLSDKEFNAMFDRLEAVEELVPTWNTKVGEFLNGGKGPSESAADIDKLIMDAEKLGLENQKKVKDKDKAAELTKTLANLQKLKIDHRKNVGTLLARFETLDASGAKQMADAAKAIVAKVDETTGAAERAVKEAVTLIQNGKRDAMNIVNRNAGYLSSQKEYADKFSKLTGRTVKSAVDIDTFRSAQDRAAGNLEKLVKTLEMVTAAIKKA